VIGRITTDTSSAAPAQKRAKRLSQKVVDRPKTTVAAPKAATATSSFQPAPPRIGKRASSSAKSSAPIEGAARKRPRPQGPVWRMSRAKMGRRATAPPSSTAKRSSVIAPRMMGWAKMNRRPASTSADLDTPGSRGARPVRCGRTGVITTRAMSSSTRAML
jgi:hypothetical protein